MSSFRFFIHH